MRAILPPGGAVVQLLLLLLLAIVPGYLHAFPADFHFDPVEEPDYDNLTFPEHEPPKKFLARRALTNVDIQGTCNADQKALINQAFIDAQNAADVAFTNLNQIYQLMVTQTQPENWPRIQLVNVDITFWTYWAYFYFPNLDLETALGAMKNVAVRIKKLRNALRDDRYLADVNCDDSFLVFSRMDTLNGNAVRIYTDTRGAPENQVEKMMAASQRTCAELEPEGGGLKVAYTYPHPTTGRDQVNFCAIRFREWGTNNFGTFKNMPFSTLVGAQLDGIKRVLIGQTLIHEMTHSTTIYGNNIALDQPLDPTDPGSPKAYGSDGIHALNKNRATQSLTWKNADTLAYFILAMYLSQYDWSEFDCDTYSIDEQWFDKDGKWLTFNYAGANLAGLGGD